MLPFISGGASASCSFITVLICTSFPGPEKKYPFIYILLVCEIVFSNFLSKSCVISDIVELTLICLVGGIGHIVSRVDCTYSRHLGKWSKCCCECWLRRTGSWEVAVSRSFHWGKHQNQITIPVRIQYSLEHRSGWANISSHLSLTLFKNFFLKGILFSFFLQSAFSSN